MALATSIGWWVFGRRFTWTESANLTETFGQFMVSRPAVHSPRCRTAVTTSRRLITLYETSHNVLYEMLHEEVFSSDGEVLIAASVATGLENVAASEIAEKILGKPANEAVVTKQGRVYFHASKNSLAAIHSLRSVDRVFFVVKRCEDYFYKESKEDTLADLTKLANDLQWTEIIKFWFYNRPYCKGRWRQEDLGKKTSQKSKNRIPAEKEDTLATETGDATTIPDSENVVILDSLTKPTSPKRQKCDAETCRGVSDNSNGADLARVTVDHDVAIVGNKKVSDTATTTTKIPTVAPDGTLVRFRVSTNRVGKKQPITSPEASYQFGGEIQNITKWKVDLSNYNLEVMLCLGQSSLEVTVALTLQSLHRRNITHFGMTTLRATTAYCMLRLCNIKPGDLVVDPMCGSGAIPVEGSLEWPESFHIGGDHTKAAVTRCKNNVRHIDENPHFVMKYIDDAKSCRMKNLPADVIRWDVTELPVRTSCVDVIVSDLPFGKRVGSKTDNRKLYPALLKEFARIARPETGRACLLTQDKRTIIRALEALSELWRVKKTLYINIGGLTAGVFLLKRTKNCFQSEN